MGQNYEVALIGTVLSVLLLAALYMIGLFILTLYEAAKCKKNMKRLSEFQREFIFTPQAYDRASAVSGMDYHTPRHSKIGKMLNFQNYQLQIIFIFKISSKFENAFLIC